MSRVCCIVGARPNLIKMAPVVKGLAARELTPMLIHTGQHYDARLSRVFFDQLRLPPPDLNLGAGGGTHAEQTGRIMMLLEPHLQAQRPELLVVAGDVNSTLAAALTAAKLAIPVAHVEAGLRSFDRTMPEEINRVLTDHIAELLFTTEAAANANLEREGIARQNIFFVGNCMIDTLDAHLEQALAGAPWQTFGVTPGAYGVVTLHRPANVDEPAALARILDALTELSRALPLIFPVHPRTRSPLARAQPTGGRIQMVEPLGYLEFLGLMAKARLILSDSGGIQEEATALGVPLLTLRPNTERPVTLETGLNRLVGSDRTQILSAAHDLLAHPPPPRARPPLWDGQAGARVAETIQRWLDALAGQPLLA